MLKLAGGAWARAELCARTGHLEHEQEEAGGTLLLRYPSSALGKLASSSVAGLCSFGR